MLFMLIVKASTISEAEKNPSPGLEEAMDKYNDDLVEAGVRVMAKGLHPSSTAIRFSYPKEGENAVITYGPFNEPGSFLVSGFILINVSSREEAIMWAKRMPDPIGYGEGQIELRQVFE